MWPALGHARRQLWTLTFTSTGSLVTLLSQATNSHVTDGSI